MLQQSTDLTGLTRVELGQLLDECGVGRVHARSVFSALHRERQQPENISILGPRKAARLAEAGHRPTVSIVDDVLSEDGTEKLVFELRDSQKVEGVLIPQDGGRVTFCVSSQVGCAMGCTFCATATMGLIRSLSAGEIVEQVALARRRAAERGETIRNIVFMGMGEPLHNYAAVARSIRILSDHLGQMHAQRHITVSTVGLVPKIAELARDFGGRIQLAVSLSAGTMATRSEIVPITKRHDLASLQQACLDYPLPGARRFILVEYVLLAGVTDTAEELAGLIEWVRPLRCLVNLIPWNGFEGARFESPTRESAMKSAEALRTAGVPTTIRAPRGREVGAACGQLVRAAS